jgi:hypothetical protein
MAMQFSGNKWQYKAEQERQKGLDRRHEGPGDKFLSYLGTTVLDLGKTLGTEYFKWKVGGGEEAHEIDEIKAGALKTEAGAKKTEADSKASLDKERLRLTGEVLGSPQAPTGGADLAKVAGVGPATPSLFVPGRQTSLDVDLGDGVRISRSQTGKDFGTLQNQIDLKEKEIEAMGDSARASAAGQVKVQKLRNEQKELELERDRELDPLRQEAASELKTVQDRLKAISGGLESPELVAEAKKLSAREGKLIKILKSGKAVNVKLSSPDRLVKQYFGKSSNSETEMAAALRVVLGGMTGDAKALSEKVNESNVVSLFIGLIKSAQSPVDSADRSEAQEILRGLIRVKGGGVGGAGVEEQVKEDIGSGKVVP